MKSGLRVTHIIGGGEFGGAEEHILQLLEVLKEHNITPHVICFYDSLFAKRLRERNIEVDVLAYGRFDFTLYFGLVKLLKEKQPNIVHTHGVKANFFGRLAAKKANISPVVTTVHSLLKFDYEHPVARFVVQLMENRTRPKTDYFIAISETIKKQLVEDGVDYSKIVVVHHGINTELYAPKENETAKVIAQEWGKSDQIKIIGAIGRLKEVKGFPYFIEACSILHRKHPGKYRFVIVGGGPELDKLKEKVSSLQLDDVFVFAGFRDDVAQCLQAMDCYVSASLSEGLGLSVMEALASGTPVVTTAVGGVLDFARNEENALLVPPESGEKLAEAIERIMENKELAHQLSTTAVSDMQATFSVYRMGEQTAKHYNEWANSSR